MTTRTFKIATTLSTLLITAALGCQQTNIDDNQRWQGELNLPVVSALDSAVTSATYDCGFGQCDVTLYGDDKEVSLGTVTLKDCVAGQCVEDVACNGDLNCYQISSTLHTGESVMLSMRLPVLNAAQTVDSVTHAFQICRAITGACDSVVVDSTCRYGGGCVADQTYINDVPVSQDDAKDYFTTTLAVFPELNVGVAASGELMDAHHVGALLPSLNLLYEIPASDWNPVLVGESFYECMNAVCKDCGGRPGGTNCTNQYCAGDPSDGCGVLSSAGCVALHPWGTAGWFWAQAEGSKQTEGAIQH